MTLLAPSQWVGQAQSMIHAPIEKASLDDALALTEKRHAAPSGVFQSFLSDELAW